MSTSKAPAPAAGGTTTSSTAVALTNDEMKKFKELSGTRQDFWRLYPRLQYDISAYELLLGYYYAFVHSPSAKDVNGRIAKNWHGKQPECVVTALSVRTFFDALLTVLALPAGSEVLMSALTIPHMADILKFHKLVPVAFDVDFIEFQPNIEQCKTLISPKTKLMLVAPLFGRPMRDCTKIAELARQNNIMFILDGAQSFSIRDIVEEIPYDILMVSFGSIKFSTALGGAIATVKDTELAEKVRKTLEKHPVRANSTHMKNMLKYGFTIGVDDPISFGIMRNVFELFGMHIGEFVNRISRGFPGDDLIGLIRHQPPPAMLALLNHRISHVSLVNRLRHCQSAWHIISQLPNYIQVVSAGDPKRPAESTFWLFALFAQEPQMCFEIFQAYGFDAALGTSQMRSMGGPEATPNSFALIKHILYVPIYAAIGEEKRTQLIQLFKEIPRKLIQSPWQPFHDHVAKTPEKHAYRSPEVTKLLEKRAPFKELPPGLLMLAASPVGATLALKSML